MDVNKLFETTVGELDRILTSKSVVADPIQVNGKTIIPLVSIGFGFGVGVGEGGPGSKAPGQGLGSAGGGGVKPVAVVVVDAAGVRVESIKAMSSVISKIADSVTEIARAQLGPGAAKKTEA